MNPFFNSELIAKYSGQGPRYTSYPTAVEFKNDYTAEVHHSIMTQSNATGRDLSLYAHIPFCDTVCFYCACNKIITSQHQHSIPYMQALEKEIAMQAALLDGSRRVVQMHWGGGTPTFLSDAQQAHLMQLFRDRFPFASDEEGEYSIEIDPRTIDAQGIARLRSIGFNRLSFGVQDFNPEVQRAVNRIQPYEQTAAVIQAGREQKFHSLSVDLIYGLPKQSEQSFAATVEQLIALNPDRIAVFNYAHLPQLFKAQKQINAEDLPSGVEKLNILENTIEQLVGAGYVFIGLDHFAKPDDSLVIHQNNGTLYRNFQGYSTFSQCDLLGFGISSISMFDTAYSQNAKTREDYYAALDRNVLPVVRGVHLNRDDLIRRHVITEIMCNMRLSLPEISRAFNFNAAAYFADEWHRLEALADDKLLRLNAEELEVLPYGRLLIRNIAMIFDAYLNSSQHSFSKVI